MRCFVYFFVAETLFNPEQIEISNPLFVEWIKKDYRNHIILFIKMEESIIVLAGYIYC